MVKSREMARTDHDRLWNSLGFRRQHPMCHEQDWEHLKAYGLLLRGERILLKLNDLEFTKAIANTKMNKPPTKEIEFAKTIVADEFLLEIADIFDKIAAYDEAKVVYQNCTKNTTAWYRLRAETYALSCIAKASWVILKCKIDRKRNQ